jgi:chorismate synthase
MFSIGAVKGVEIGAGFGAAAMRGSENNDQYAYPDAAGKDACMYGRDVRPVKTTNHAGGILGGMSDGSDVLIRVAFKPTPSIARPQTALAADGSIREIEIRGRHDPVIVPRAVVVVECMAAITVLDLLMRDLPSRLDW